MAINRLSFEIAQIGDILMERINGLEIRICDFGLAQRVIPGTTHFVEFGHPEFVSPEIVSKNSVTFSSDVWSGNTKEIS